MLRTLCASFLLPLEILFSLLHMLVKKNTIINHRFHFFCQKLSLCKAKSVMAGNTPTTKQRLSAVTCGKWNNIWLLAKQQGLPPSLTFESRRDGTKPGASLRKRPNKNEYEHYCLNGRQSEERAGAQLCPEPVMVSARRKRNMHNGEIMESSNNLLWPSCCLSDTPSWPHIINVYMTGMARSLFFFFTLADEILRFPSFCFRCFFFLLATFPHSDPCLSVNLMDSEHVQDGERHLHALLRSSSEPFIVQIQSRTV